MEAFFLFIQAKKFEELRSEIMSQAPSVIDAQQHEQRKQELKKQEERMKRKQQKPPPNKQNGSSSSSSKSSSATVSVSSLVEEVVPPADPKVTNGADPSWLQGTSATKALKKVRTTSQLPYTL